MMETDSCEDACATSSSCNYKNGKCGSCSFGCFEDMLKNDSCDEPCLTESCGFDSEDCDNCGSGCFYEFFYERDGDFEFMCYEPCNTYECNFGSMDGFECPYEYLRE
mmetsp:Transcript_6368/g.813  ORF Transcript_6368/g.813 Transcript_6368/m.813 type:complete len:107 (+) Transcript_6368:125-445(+)